MNIVSNDLTHSKGFTLVAIVRNELYVLPAILNHYRKLGIERFIILDDLSDDGTREFLAEQSDVMVVASDARYGELISPDGRTPLPDMRSNIIWRNVLMWKYCFGRWAVMLDADEFIKLPNGMLLPDILSKVEEGRYAIYGVMLDVYPKNISALSETFNFDPLEGWYFDGQPHLKLQADGAISAVYPGARARLMVRYGIRKISLRNRVRNHGTLGSTRTQRL